MHSPSIYRDKPWVDWAWLAFLGLFTSFYCITSAARLSATFDEPFYLKAGLDAWRTGDTNLLMRAGTMPLPVDVQSAGIYAWEQYRGIPFDIEAEFGTILPWFRAGNLVFWLLLLVYSLKLGNLLGGPWAGRMAAALVALDPNMLAHASLATTDISITAAMVMFVYHYLTTRESNGWKRVGLIGLLYGFAILTKASGLVFVPLSMVVLEAFRLWPHMRLETAGLGWKQKIGWVWRATRTFRRDGWRIAAIGLVVTFAWCGSAWRPQPSFVKWANGLPEGTLKTGVAWFAEHFRVFPNAGEGLAYQIKHNFRGHGVFILGEWHTRAVWYYFPVTLLIKLSLPVLGVLALILLGRRDQLRNPVFLLVVAFFLFSLNCRVQIGVRFMLPLVAFILVFLSSAVIQSRPGNWPVPVRRGLVAACLLAMAIPSLIAWPNGLCYANQLFGGASKTHEYLADSSCDWGQGLPELLEWQKSHADAPLRVWYFGMDPLIHKPPLQNLPIHTLNLVKPGEVDSTLAGGYFAVGTTLLSSGASLPGAGSLAVERLRAVKPIGRTTTFFIYDFRDATRLP